MFGDQGYSQTSDDPGWGERYHSPNMETGQREISPSFVNGRKEHFGGVATMLAFWERLEKEVPTPIQEQKLVWPVFIPVPIFESHILFPVPISERHILFQ